MAKKKTKKKTKKKVKKKKATNEKQKPKVKRTAEGKYPAGVSGNPNGRPKGSSNKFSIKELVQAIRDVEEERKMPLLKHFVNGAYDNPTVLIALAKKLLPDLKSIEGLLATYDATMTDEVAEAIRKKLLKRYGNISTAKTESDN